MKCSNCKSENIEKFLDFKDVFSCKNWGDLFSYKGD
jgi:hypothetical protein